MVYLSVADYFTVVSVFPAKNDWSLRKNVYVCNENSFCFLKCCFYGVRNQCDDIVFTVYSFCR